MVQAEQDDLDGTGGMLLMSQEDLRHRDLYVASLGRIYERQHVGAVAARGGGVAGARFGAVHPVSSMMYGDGLPGAVSFVDRDPMAALQYNPPAVVPR